MTAQPDAADAELTVWNQWRDSSGGIFASIGNQGIVVVRESADSVELHCSDGVGDPHFEDLIVRLTFTPVADR
jgi:hypothetical protein